jgi:hypothetical protein
MLTKTLFVIEGSLIVVSAAVILYNCRGSIAKPVIMVAEVAEEVSHGWDLSTTLHRRTKHYATGKVIYWWDNDYMTRGTRCMSTMYNLPNCYADENPPNPCEDRAYTLCNWLYPRGE